MTKKREEEVIKFDCQEEGDIYIYITHRCSGLPASFNLLSSCFTFKTAISKTNCSSCRLLRISGKRFIPIVIEWYK